MTARHKAIGGFLTVLATVSGLAVTGNGSFAESKPKPKLQTCPANGTALAVKASDNKYDKDCLAVPANQAFTIDFDNQDRGIPHNVSIYDESQGDEKPLFKGEVIGEGGPAKTTYKVPAEPQGRYVFRCDPHPEFMVGDFVVGNPPPPAETTTTSTAPPSTTTTTSGLKLPKVLPNQTQRR
ncbi:MAG TPA: cupredoxin domain-containing protein [Acidimicrobiia bacterium]|jgi:plastocyanin|nr:hypothetical protein [Actinomycetota bacterium]MDQ1502634.1 hypothetical protein [Actinomycetota bacterium]